MFSLNAPLPPAFKRLATDRRAALLPAEEIRDELTLVVKRLPADSWDEYVGVERSVRRELDTVGSVAAQTGGVGMFPTPPAGPAPVLYLDIASPGLQALHQRLVDRFGAVDGIEGDAYVPHVTLARGPGSETALEQLRAHGIPTIEWTIDRLTFRDGRRSLDIGDLSLEAA